jgi:AraC-like DNA-binding protein
MTKFNHFELLSVEKAPIDLPKEFPVSKALLYEQADKDITALHHHNCLEIGYCYEGSGIFVIEDQIYPFQKGDASLIHEGRIHLAQSTKGTSSQWRFLCLDEKTLTEYFNTDQKELLQQWRLMSKSKIVKKEIQPKVIEIIHSIIDEVVSKNEHYQNLVKLKLGELVMQTLRDDRELVKTNKEFNSKSFQRILPAVQHIIRNYADPIKMDHLANLCHLSPAQFRRLFLSAMDTSPQSYLISIRLNHADQLLQSTDHKIVDIAQKVGFSTLSSFNRAFQLTRHRKPKNSRTPTV